MWFRGGDRFTLKEAIEAEAQRLIGRAMWHEYRRWSTTRLIAEYVWYHQRRNIWPEVIENVLSPGILSEEMYLLGTRLVMIPSNDS
jgi:hypothetical protein